MRRDPYPWYDRARGGAPVVQLAPLDVWAILDYQGVKDALSDPAAFSSAIRAPDWLVFMDPPRHTKLRALILKAFTPRVIAGLEARIREISRRLLEAALP